MVNPGNTATMMQAAAAVCRCTVGTGILFLPKGVAAAGAAGAVLVFIPTLLLFLSASTLQVECWRVAMESSDFH